MMNRSVAIIAFITNLVLSFTIISCSKAQTIKDDDLLRFLRIDLDNEQINVVRYDTLKIGSSTVIVKPVIPITKFDKTIQIDSTEISEIDCQGELFIYYRLRSLTKNFISIEKKVVGMCDNYPSDITYEETYNIFMYDGIFYHVKLNDKSRWRNYVYNRLDSILDDNCLKDIDVSDITGELVFEKNRALVINPLNSKLCFEEIELGINGNFFEVRPINNAE